MMLGLTFCGLCNFSFCGDGGVFLDGPGPLTGLESCNLPLRVGMPDCILFGFFGLYAVMTTSSDSLLTARSVNVFFGIVGEFSFRFGDPKRCGELPAMNLLGEGVRGEDPGRWIG